MARGNANHGGSLDGTAVDGTTPDLASLLYRPGPGPHRVTVSVGGRETTTLADLPPFRDRLLFVGASPSPASTAAGHYLQDGLGPTFWEWLIEAEILPTGTTIDGADDALVARGHGLTSLLGLPPAADVAPTRNLAAGVGPLWQKVAIWRPAAVIFIERSAAEATAGRRLAERWGRLSDVALAGRPCLLLPDPTEPAEEIRTALAFFRDLAGIIEGVLTSDPEAPSGDRPVERAARLEQE